jgi:hypothetical protein
MSMKIPVLGSAFGIVVAAFIGAVHARDDGRYSLSPLKPWFDGLRSGKGPCCSDADGFALSDPADAGMKGQSASVTSAGVSVPAKLEIGRHEADEWLNIGELGREFGVREKVFRRLAESGHLTTRRADVVRSPIQMRRADVMPIAALYKEELPRLVRRNRVARE